MGEYRCVRKVVTTIDKEVVLERASNNNSLNCAIEVTIQTFVQLGNKILNCWVTSLMRHITEYIRK
jgi:hypothetical protein